MKYEYCMTMQSYREAILIPSSPMTMELVSLLRGAITLKECQQLGRLVVSGMVPGQICIFSHCKQCENLILILCAFTATFYHKMKPGCSTSIASVLVETRFLNGLCGQGTKECPVTGTKECLVSSSQERHWFSLKISIHVCVFFMFVAADIYFGHMVFLP